MGNLCQPSTPLPANGPPSLSHHSHGGGIHTRSEGVEAVAAPPHQRRKTSTTTIKVEPNRRSAGIAPASADPASTTTILNHPHHPMQHNGHSNGSAGPPPTPAMLNHHPATAPPPPGNSIMPLSAGGTRTNSAEVSRRIDEEILLEHKAMEKVIKLLLLGPSESGKSTVLKQMRIIHLNGYSHEELYSRRTLIFHNTVQSMVQIIRGLRRFGMKLSIEREIDAAAVSALGTADSVNDTDLGRLASGIPETVYWALKRLWRDDKVQAIYERRSE